jgi:hypothetical protein
LGSGGSGFGHADAGFGLFAGAGIEHGREGSSDAGDEGAGGEDGAFLVGDTLHDASDGSEDKEPVAEVGAAFLFDGDLERLALDGGGFDGNRLGTEAPDYGGGGCGSKDDDPKPTFH